MILIILFVLGAVISWGYNSESSYEDEIRWLPWVFLALCGVSIGACIYLNYIGVAEHLNINKQELVAIRDKDGMSGSFFIGSGSIKEEQYYFYYKKLPDGGFKSAKLLANDVTIYEENRSDAVLLTYDYSLNNGWWWFVTVPSCGCNLNDEFHVPIGTIRRGFSI